MKVPKTATHLILVLEGFLFVLVLVFAVLNPSNRAMEKTGWENPTQPVVEEGVQETEDTQENTVEPVVYSQEVQEKVSAMSLEEKVAQMFVTTPEELTSMRQVTATGNTTKNAISEIPVGGLMYGEKNFEGQTQTSSMTQNLQSYYTQQYGMSLFLMVEEAGGEERSPLAKGNGFSVQASPEEIGAGNDTETAYRTAETIAGYMLQQGINTNAGLDNSYSEDSTVAENMLDAAITAYKGAGVYTASRSYHIGTDILMLSGEDVSTEHISYLRNEAGYQGILLAEGLSDAQSVTDAVVSGVDMLYCSTDFKTLYQSVVDAINQGSILEETIDTAVMRILTCKGYGTSNE